MGTGFLAYDSLEINAVERARQERLIKGLPLLDLTSANPTLHGYLFPQNILKKASDLYWQSRRYEPQGRGLLPAREAVCSYYSQYRGCSFLPEQIFMTASTSESYSLLFTLLASSGDNILVPEITYPLFDLLAQSREIELHPYRLIEDKEWRIDCEHLARCADSRTRAVLIISPNNPTGMIVRGSENAISQLNLPIICDEVFAEFTDDSPAPCMASMYPDVPVFVLNGISKMFALPDMKLGWIALNKISEQRYAERLDILNDTFLSASSLIQSMMPALVAEGMTFCRKMTAAIRSNVHRAADFLDVKAPPAGAFLFPRLADDIDEEAVVIELIHTGVLTHPGYFYGCSSASHLMISCVPPFEVMEPGLRLVRPFL